MSWIFKWSMKSWERSCKMHELTSRPDLLWPGKGAWSLFKNKSELLKIHWTVDSAPKGQDTKPTGCHDKAWEKAAKVLTWQAWATTWRLIELQLKRTFLGRYESYDQSFLSGRLSFRVKSEWRLLNEIKFAFLSTVFIYWTNL
jgi:hypothetical protein